MQFDREAFITISESIIGFCSSGHQFTVEQYTREAGVRQLERRIGACCRYVALQLATNSDTNTVCSMNFSMAIR